MTSTLTRKPVATLTVTLLVVLAAFVPSLGVVGIGAAAGSVSSCTTIGSPGTYSLTADVIDSGAVRCIEITANDVVLDGQGYTIDGTGTGYGVWVDNTSATATNVTVENLVVTDWGDGVHFLDVEQSVVRNVEARRNTNGVYFDQSKYNTVESVTATRNQDGLYLYDSSSNTVQSSDFSDNSMYGVEQAYSGTNTFTNLVVNDNAKGFILSDSHHIENSEIRNNSEWGIYLGGVNNVLTGNTIAGNGQYGLIVDSDAGWLNGNSYPNSIYDNSFNNTNNTNAGSSLYSFTTYPNDWNTTKTTGTNVIGGSTVGGNYWATPDGTGFSETCTDGDGDGICDSAYSLDTDNTDELPLADPAAQSSNQAPSATFSYSPTSPTTDDTVTFDAQNSADADGSIASYEWDFESDGVTDATGKVVDHSFAAAGDTLVTLTVTDDDGATAQDSQMVSVGVGDGTGGVVSAPGTATVYQDAPDYVAPGDTVVVELDATELDGLLVRANSTLGNAGNATLSLSINGSSQPFETTKTFSSPQTGIVTVEVATDPGLVDRFRLEFEDVNGDPLANASATSVHPDPITVPGDLSSIQDAVDVATPGSTVEVDDGTYEEAVDVDKNLTLTAATGATPTIAYATGITDFYLVTATDGSNVTVAGFTLDGGGETGGLGAYTDSTLTARDVTVNRSDNRAGVSANGAGIVAEDLVVQNSENMGLLANYGGRLTIDGLTVDNTTGSAIVVKRDSVATVQYGTIIDAGLSGVTVQENGDATVEYVTVSAPGEHGVYVHTGANATVRNVAVNNPAENGIHVSGANATVRGSSVTGALNGVRVEDGATATVEGGTVTNSGYYGLISSDGAHATFVDNDVGDAGNAGIEFWNATGTSRENVVDGNSAMVGLSVTAGGNATFEDDVVYGNHDVFHGLEVDGATATARDLTVTEMALAGVYLHDDASVTVEGANLTAINGPGIDVRANSALTASDVRITDAFRSVYVKNSEATLSESSLEQVTSAGVWFVDSTGFVINTTIDDVDDFGNPDIGDGIRAEADSFVTVANATISGVANRGVFVNSSSHATVLKSNVTAWNEGVAFENYASGAVQDSTIDGEYGVYASGGGSVSVTGSTLTANGGAGVRLVGTGGTISDNAIEDVRWGVYTYDGTVEVSNNTITNASELGMRLNHGLVTVRDNYVEGGSNGGLALGNVNGVVADNVVVAPDRDGIALLDDSATEIRGNVVHAWTGVDLASMVHITKTMVGMNDLSNTTVAIDNGNSSSPVPLVAMGNWYGPRGPVNTSVEGDVTYEPFLTAPPDQVDANETQQFGFDLDMTAGQVYALGTPAPLEENLSTVFGDFDGAVYLWDESGGSWTLASGDETLGPMDAVAVVATSDARAVLDFADATPPRPTERQLSTGWNFVAPRSYDDLSDGFSTTTVGITDVSQSMAGPTGQPAAPGDYFGHYSLSGSIEDYGGGPRVSPFEGYFVYVDETGSIPGTVLYGERADDVRVHLNVGAGGKEVLV